MLTLDRWGVWAALDHFSADQALTYGRAAEEAGYAAIWTRESTGRDPFGLLSAVSAVTERIRLGLGIASVYARDPVSARAAAMTLHEFSHGRLIMGLGVSHQHVVEGVRGHRYGPPVKTMREYLAQYRDAQYLAPMPHGQPPVVMAALGERMFGLAAREADGVFPYFVPLSYIRRARQSLDELAKTSNRQPKLISTVAVRVDNDAGRARRAAREYVRHYLSRPNYVRNLSSLGFSASDLASPGSDRLIDSLVAVGSSSDVRARMREYLAAGVDHLAIIPLNAVGEMADTQALEELAPPW